MPDPAGTGAGESLERVLEDSRRLGFLGPGPLPPQIEHARGFASTRERAPDSFLDLGSGGGLPGLVLALEWPRAYAVLLDAMAKRTEFLRTACTRLGISERVEVRCARAEDAGRDPALRGRFDVVTARSFGPPAVTAECAAGLLRPGGELIVSMTATVSPKSLFKLGIVGRPAACGRSGISPSFPRMSCQTSSAFFSDSKRST